MNLDIQTLLPILSFLLILSLLVLSSYSKLLFLFRYITSIFIVVFLFVIVVNPIYAFSMKMKKCRQELTNRTATVISKYTTTSVSGDIQWVPGFTNVQTHTTYNSIIEWDDTKEKEELRGFNLTIGEKWIQKKDICEYKSFSLYEWFFKNKRPQDWEPV